LDLNKWTPWLFAHIVLYPGTRFSGFRSFVDDELHQRPFFLRLHFSVIIVVKRQGPVNIIKVPVGRRLAVHDRYSVVLSDPGALAGDYGRAV
jgi:hypothetical protein